MKILSRLFALSALSTLAAFAQAPRDTRPDTPLLAPPVAPALKPDSNPAIAAVRIADDRRLAAMSGADRAALDAICSDELHYGHSSGKVDTKATLIESLTSRRTVYEKFNYKERSFVPAGSDAMLMKGRVIVDLLANGQKIQIDLSYLAVWRNENGVWRFLAWQSCRNPPAP